MILNEGQRKQISSAIAGIEKDTDAELVTVLAKRADNYYYIPTLWAAVIALVLPILIRFTPLWLTGDELLLMQWATWLMTPLMVPLKQRVTW